MADLLTRQAPLRDVYAPGHYGATGPNTPGITLKARTGLRIFDVQIWTDSPEKVRTSIENGDFTAIWFGPDRWLLSGRDVDFTLGEMDGLLVDLSHGMSVIRLGGPRMRDLLSKGSNIDLRRSAISEGDGAMTQLDHIPVKLHFVAQDCVDIYFRRSYAVSLFEWLLAGAREYGCRVEESEDA